MPIDHLGWIDISAAGAHRRALEDILAGLPAPDLVAALDVGREELTIPSWGEGDSEWAHAAAEFLVASGRLPAASLRLLVKASLDHVHAWCDPDDHDLLYGADMELSEILSDVADEPYRLWHDCLAAIEGRPATHQ